MGDVVVKIGDADAEEQPAQAEAVAEDNAAVVGALESSSQVLASSSEHAAQAVQAPRRVLATPVARQLAKDLGVDINTVTGTGPAGRVMKIDILQAAEKAQEAVLPTAPPVEPSAAPAAPQARPVLASAGTGGLEERVALTTLGKTVARNMALSKQEIPCRGDG